MKVKHASNPKPHNSLLTTHNFQRDARGVVLLTVLLVCLLVTFVGLSLADLTAAQYGRTARNVSVSNSLLTSEAGVEQSLYQLNTNSNFAGFAETQFFNNQTQGRGTYQSTVTAGSGPNEKIITTTGRVYKYNQSTDPISTRKIKVTVVGTSSEGYSVYSGPGGLILTGSASITNSDLYIGGTISLGGASRIGTAAQPLTVNVAHKACPTGSSPGATYAVVCSTGQPITMAYSTAIYGSVCATNQTSVGPNNNIKTGTGGQGLIPNCTAPEVSMPTYDRDAHIAAVTTTSAGNNIAYNCSQYQNPVGFVRTWPAHLKLTGNVSASSSCDLTITGDVYITGNLDIGGAARIKIANSLGTTRPVIMVDGTITVGGSATLIPNSSGTGAHFVSFRSSASCTPNCTNVTGNDLKTSSNLTTVNVSGAGSFPGGIFQAYWGKVVMGGSGTAGSAIGQTVDLSGAGTITFGTSLSSGDATWTIRSYQQEFD
jgi:Tfp pilus assembly protein PilX